MNKRHFLVATTGALALALAACTTATGGGDASTPAAKRASIDSAVDAALSNLYAQAPGSRELAAKARGVLVFPNVVSAGFVVGGSYGQGALRVGGSTAGYYSTAAGSVGLLAGAETKQMYVLFMTDDALNKFRNSNGWTMGADASVTLVKVSADAVANSELASQQVVAYVLAKGGLMANLSLDGTKINKLDL
jgi:lipid-binding SYLF domain-containing protein